MKAHEFKRIAGCYFDRPSLTLTGERKDSATGKVVKTIATVTDDGGLSLHAGRATITMSALAASQLVEWVSNTFDRPLSLTNIDTRSPQEIKSNPRLE